MALKRKKVEVYDCACEKCDHNWVSLAVLPPAICPSCKSRAWNGEKRVGRPVGLRDTSKLGLPKPKRMRTL